MPEYRHNYGCSIRRRGRTVLHARIDQAKDILVHPGPQSSLYRFKINLIRRWIGISRPAVAAIAA
jgi:hypothetical protein